MVVPQPSYAARISSASTTLRARPWRSSPCRWPPTCRLPLRTRAAWRWSATTWPRRPLRRCTESLVGGWALLCLIVHCGYLFINLYHIDTCYFTIRNSFPVIVPTRNGKLSLIIIWCLTYLMKNPHGLVALLELWHNILYHHNFM